MVIAAVFAGRSYAADIEYNPFAISPNLLELLTGNRQSTSEINGDLTTNPTKPFTLINGLPHIRLQAVSLTSNKRSALLQKKDGGTLLVAEGDRLYLIEQGHYVEINVLEIKPRSIRIQLGPQGQIIEVQ